MNDDIPNREFRKWSKDEDRRLLRRIKKYDDIEKVAKKHKRSINNIELRLDNLNNNFIPDIYAYTDGSCSNNGKKGAKAGIGVYFSKNDTRNVSERIIGKQTNNTAELKAIIKAYNTLENDIKNDKNILILSDSIYAIRCCTTYGKKCELVNWKNKKGLIPNAELVKKAYSIFKHLNNVKLKYIKAHTGLQDIHSIGNDNADRLANESIKNF